MPARDTFRRLLALITKVSDRRLLSHMLATAALVMAGGAMAALSPLALKHLVDAAAGGAAMSGAILAPGALYVVILCSGRIVGDIRPILANVIEQNLMAALRRHFFRHVLHLPLSSLLQRRSGELIHGLELGRAGVQLIVMHLINSFAPVIVELVVMVLILAQLHQAELIPLFGITAALYLAVFAAGSVRLTPHARSVTDASMAIHGQLADSVANVETLRCFGAERSAQQCLDSASAVLTGRWRHYHRLSAGTALAATAVFGISLAACLFVTAEEVVSGSLSVGGLVLSSVYLLQMMRPLEVLGSAARDLSRALVFVQPLLDVLDEAPEPSQPLLAASRPATPGHAPAIRFEGITFGYEADHPVIRELNLDVTPGRTTAIVGPSGSGKSSLIRLLLRLHEPQSGRILLDGVPIDSLPPAELRAWMALVPQDTTLLHTSIAANISLGMSGVSHDDIVRAATAAQLHQLVDALPDRYETLVGERGLRLSGGERQRLAIARAALRAPAVFLLDEPTSMLDGKTESDVMQAVRTLTAGATTIIVAHRLSTVMGADEIVVIDQGAVRERGRHRELLAQGGLYAQLWQSQVNGNAPRLQAFGREPPPTERRHQSAQGAPGAVTAFKPG